MESKRASVTWMMSSWSDIIRDVIGRFVTIGYTRYVEIGYTRFVEMEENDDVWV
jgi:hypothetical protein